MYLGLLAVVDHDVCDTGITHVHNPSPPPVITTTHTPTHTPARPLQVLANKRREGELLSRIAQLEEGLAAEKAGRQTDGAKLEFLGVKVGVGVVGRWGRWVGDVTGVVVG